LAQKGYQTNQNAPISTFEEKENIDSYFYKKIAPFFLYRIIVFVKDFGFLSFIIAFLT